MDKALEAYIDNFHRIHEITPPKTLYRFFSLDDNPHRCDRDLKTLENNERWFSSVKAFNDIYEYRGVNINRESLLKHGYPDIVVDGLEKILHPDDSIFVACFSENDQNMLPMWAYYTNDYHGYCVKYDVLSGAKIHPVHYEEKRVDITNLYHEWAKALKNRDMNTVNSIGSLFRGFLYIKHLSWDWEKEWRMLYNNPNHLTNPDCKGVAVNFSTINLRVSKIISGVKCETQYKDRLKSIAKTLSAEYRQAVISDNSFGFEEK